MADLKVVIRNRKKTFYEGSAESVTSFNDTGEFDVLPQHARFITIIKDKIIVRKDKQQKQEIDVDKGVMKVDANEVDVYLGVGSL
jgi:F0F1-type ATP synthase epsilon subunit